MKKIKKRCCKIKQQEIKNNQKVCDNQNQSQNQRGIIKKKTFGCTNTKDEIGEIVYKGLKWQTDSICRLLMASCRTVKENHK